METIYSGLFVHEHGYYPTNWTERAITRQQKYCGHMGFAYELVTDIPWGLKYPLRHAWSFGTTIKFVALEHFLCSSEPYFTWIDLDVYPTDRAFNYQIPECNLLYAPFVPWGFSDEPGHSHMRCKREWCGFKSDYYAVNTGMFRLDREAVTSLWGYINADHNIASDAWWHDYYTKQLSFSEEQPWLYGSEEAIFELWLNGAIANGLKFTQLKDDVHSVQEEKNPIFLHFYSNRKSEYPH